MIPFSHLDLDTQKDFAAAFARRFSTAQQKRELLLQAGLSIQIHEALDNLRLWQEIFSQAEKRGKTESLVRATIELRPDDEILLAISDVLQPAPTLDIFDRFSYRNNQARYKRYGALSGLVFSLGLVGMLFSSSDGDASNSSAALSLTDLPQQSLQSNLVSTDSNPVRNTLLDSSRSNKSSGKVVLKKQTASAPETINATNDTVNEIEAEENSLADVDEKNDSGPDLLISTQSEPSSFHDPLAAALAQATDRLLEQERPSSAQPSSKKVTHSAKASRKTEKTTRVLAHKKDIKKTELTPQNAAEEKSDSAPSSKASTTFKKCNFKKGEELYGYWWGGQNLHLKKGNTIIIGEWSHVREEFPAAKNRFNVKTSSNCVLRPGEKVELKDEPVMINGHAWIAIYGSSIQE